MDTISQFALGAAVSVAVVGRRVGLARAALWGGVCGVAPDFDAFIDHGDPVSNMTLHRAETHALFWQTVASPPIAGALAWWHRERARPREAFPAWLLAVWLVLVTHALLDATTIYGTQLGLPFTNYPFGLGSIFIIDPLYTLPLIAGLVLALECRGSGALERLPRVECFGAVGGERDRGARPGGTRRATAPTRSRDPGAIQHASVARARDP